MRGVPRGRVLQITDAVGRTSGRPRSPFPTDTACHRSVAMSERRPPVAVGAPGRAPHPAVEDLAPACLAQRHRGCQSAAPAAKRHGEGLADDGVDGQLAAVDAAALVQLLPSKLGRHVGHSHQPGSAPGNRSGSPGNSSRQRPHWRGGTVVSSSGGDATDGWRGEGEPVLAVGDVRACARGARTSRTRQQRQPRLRGSPSEDFLPASGRTPGGSRSDCCHKTTQGSNY